MFALSPSMPYFTFTSSLLGIEPFLPKVSACLFALGCFLSFFFFFLSWKGGFQTSLTTLVVRNILYVVTQYTCTHLSTHIWNSSFRKYPYHLWVYCILTFFSYPVSFFKCSLYPTILLDQRVRAFVILLGYWYIVFHKLVPVYIPTSTVGE